MSAATPKNSPAKSVTKAILFCVVFTGLFMLLSRGKGLFSDSVERLTHGVAGTLAGLLTTILFLKVEGRRMSEIQLVPTRRTPLNFFAGAVIGVLLMGGIAGAVLYFSDVTIEPNAGFRLSKFLLMATALVLLALAEELGFRAYPLQTLKHAMGIRPAIILTAILFALYHLANGWTLAQSFYGPATWGLLFGLVAVASNGIAMPTGIHFAINLTTASFGMENNQTSIWSVREVVASAAREEQSVLTTIFPALTVLVVAFFGMEWYVRRKRGLHSIR